MPEINDLMNAAKFSIPNKHLGIDEARGRIGMYSCWSPGMEAPKHFVVVEIETLQNDGSYKKQTIEAELK